jgi:MFS family permease
LWQRGGAPLVGDALAHWWPAWSATWQQTWWTLAFFATFLLAAGGLLPRPRQILRAYLRDRFSRRAMLGAALLAAIAGVLLIGPAAAPLLATFTLGAVIYEALR